MIAENLMAAKPSEKARLHALQSVAYRYLEDLDTALEVLEDGHQVKWASRLARAELWANEGTVHLYAKRWDEAQEAADECIRQLPESREVKTDWGRRQQRKRAELHSAALFVRSKALLFMEDLPAALEAAKLSLAIALSERSRTAAMTVLAQILVKTGTPAELAYIGSLLKRVAKDISKKDRIAHAQIGWTEAIIAARFGLGERAERLLLRSLETFKDLGLDSQYDAALEALIWVVRERTGKEYRALYLERQLTRASTARGFGKLSAADPEIGLTPL